jgi:PilZ domain
MYKSTQEFAMGRTRGLRTASGKSAGIQPPGTPQRSERREQRSIVSVHVIVFGVTADGRLFQELVSTQNVSLRGCCIRLRTKVHSAMPLHLRVVPREGPIPDDVQPLTYQIAWMRELEINDSWELGAFALRDFDLLQMAYPSREP